MQGPSVTNSLPPDLNPKVFEAIAKNTGIAVGTLKGSDSLPATNPTLAAPSRAKPRSAHTAKPSTTQQSSTAKSRPSNTAQPSKAATYSRSPSPDYQDGSVESPHQASDVAEVRLHT